MSSEPKAREGDPEPRLRLDHHASLRDSFVPLDPLPLRRLRRLGPGMTLYSSIQLPWEPHPHDP